MTNFRFQMRKVATIVACLAVATMFAACDGNNGDDDGNGNGRTLTADEKELVGTWTLTGRQMIYRQSNGKWVKNSGDAGSGFTFFSDGTFWDMEAAYARSTFTGQNLYYADFIRYGKFSVNGNKLLLSNVRYDYFPLESAAISVGMPKESNYNVKIDDIQYYFAMGTEDNFYTGAKNVQTLRLSKVYEDPKMMAPYYIVK